tara:strand:- start:2254 stop:3087 length:834 start_codon:yes stop_codon:yes gene_type:complete
MKARHNKKRNTAFVYEALIREATAAALKNDTAQCNKIVALIKKHFKAGTVLRQDLECHRSLYESRGFDQTTSEKILKEAKLASRLLDPEGLFKAQSKLIDDINKELDSSVFNAFVPNYKTLASISQIFSLKTSPRDQVLLEQELLTTMCGTPQTTDENTDIDNLVVKTFVEKFNKKYGDELLQEQKDLLTCYISSFADNALELKMFLNEEIGRLKSSLKKAQHTPEIQSDEEMSIKTQKVVELLNNFATESINEEVLLTVLKTQSLVKEIYPDGNNS